MHWIRRVVWRLEVLFLKGRAEAELEEELRYHLDEEVRANLKEGLSPREARRKAMADFGGVERTKEQVRDARGARGLDDFVQDIRLTARRLLRSPGFTAVAVLILALGIGATVAMFSVLDAALLRSLPYPEPEGLVLGRTTYSGEINPSMSYLDYLDYKAGVDAFQSVGLIRGGAQRHTVTGGGDAERITGHWISAEVLPTLGVEP
ncbi:permease prefix domain 1-containing protein, partial [Gemmatimonadota bacterium]